MIHIGRLETDWTIESNTEDKIGQSGPGLYVYGHVWVVFLKNNSIVYTTTAFPDVVWDCRSRCVGGGKTRILDVGAVLPDRRPRRRHNEHTAHSESSREKSVYVHASLSARKFLFVVSPSGARAGRRPTLLRALHGREAGSVPIRPDVTPETKIVIFDTE